MKTKINSRSANDKKWQDCKKLVRERDHYQCRFLASLTPNEYEQVLKACDNHSFLRPTDCAHIRAVSDRPEIMYDTSNILFLCRYAHTCLDNCINPFTGLHMDNNYRWYLWSRAFHKKIFPYNPELEYEEIFYTDIPLEQESTKTPEKEKLTAKEIVSKYW